MNTIVVADDDQAICALLRDILTDEGYAVHTAFNGEQAWMITCALRPRLVMTDIMMPILDGIGLCRRINAAPATADIPIILISAAKHDEAIPVDCHCVAFVRKPFNLMDLMEAVGQAIGQRDAAP